MSYGLVDLNKLKKKLIAPADYMESSPSLEGRAFRRAAILVPFVLDNGEWSLLFTRRSETLSNPVSYTHLDVYKRQVQWRRQIHREL